MTVNINNEIPDLVRALTSSFQLMGSNENVREYYDLKQAEEKGMVPPFVHDRITFPNYPEWSVDRYQSGVYGYETYYIYRIVNPTSGIFATVKWSGLDSDALLGYPEHSTFEEIWIKQNYPDVKGSRIIVELGYDKDPVKVAEIEQARQNYKKQLMRDFTIVAVPRTFIECPCVNCRGQIDVHIETLYDKRS
jgi:hypothetical protein